MKIWVIGKAIPNAKNNFLGNFELEQARMLQKHGEDVVYIADDFRPINSIRRFGSHKVDLKDIKAYEASFPIRGLHIPNCLTKVEPKICRRLYKKVEEAEGGLPDIIHVHFPSLINAGVHQYYQKRGVKIVVTEHFSQVMEKKIQNPYLSNLSWYAQNADAVISVGETLLNSIIDIAGKPKRSFVVPNVITEDFYYKESEPKNKPFTLIAISRLVKVKRVEEIIRAFAKLSTELDADLRLKIVGGGELRSTLQDVVNELRLNDKVKLLGPLEPEKVAEEIRSSDAYVSACQLETFCVPVAEAMGCGKPVIADISIGAAPYINDSNGIKAELDSIDDICEAMKALYARRGQYNACEISEYAYQHFSEDAVYNQLGNIYREII